MLPTPKSIRHILFAITISSPFLVPGCAPEKPGIRTYAMAERAEAGYIVYSVLESSWLPRIGEGATARVPQQGFQILRLSITNGSPTEVSVPGTTLVGASGQEYAELTDGAGIEDWLPVLRRVKPAETVFGWVVFDAPRGDYHLRVSDDAFDPADAKLAMIQVPLRLSAKPDALPPPALAR